MTHMFAIYLTERFLDCPGRPTSLDLALHPSPAHQHGFGMGNTIKIDGRQDRSGKALEMIETICLQSDEGAAVSGRLPGQEI